MTRAVSPTPIRLRRLLDEATPAPWRAQPLPSHVTGCRNIQAGKPAVYRQAQWQRDLMTTSGLHDDTEDRANAELVAMLRNRAEAVELALASMAELLAAIRWALAGTDHLTDPADPIARAYAAAQNDLALLAPIR